jgi:hypothetical protein
MPSLDEIRSLLFGGGVDERVASEARFDGPNLLIDQPAAHGL